MTDHLSIIDGKVQSGENYPVGAGRVADFIAVLSRLRADAVVVQITGGIGRYGGGLVWVGIERPATRQELAQHEQERIARDLRRLAELVEEYGWPQPREAPQT